MRIYDRPLDRELIGKKHGHLFVNARDENAKGKFIVTCDCGKTLSMRMRSKNSKIPNPVSCGCMSPQQKQRKMIGEKFGSLLVKSCAGRKGKFYETYWNCLCDCGKETVKRGSTLRNGATKSCGQGCVYSPTRNDWKKYKDLESKSSWTMQFTEKEQPKLVSEKAYWKCDQCGEVELNSYQKIYTYTDPKMRKRKGYPSDANGCVACFKKRKIDPTRNTRYLSEEEVRARADEKGCDLIKYCGNTRERSTFKCRKCRCEFKRSVYSITVGSLQGCLECQLRINNVKASKPQVNLARKFHPTKKLEKFVNIKIDGLCVDIVLKDKKIAIEYDSYYCHSPSIPNKTAKDKRRNKKILDSGYKLLIIKANASVPSDEVIQNALQKLETRDKYTIRTREWRKGGKTIIDKR